MGDPSVTHVLAMADAWATHGSSLLYNIVGYPLAIHELAISDPFSSPLK